MSGVLVSVTEAAAMLGVHPQRVHQRIREGSLPAEKVGHQWAVEKNDLRRIMNHTGPGRPLSSKSAWTCSPSPPVARPQLTSTLQLGPARGRGCGTCSSMSL